MPKLTFTLEVSHGITVKSLRIWGTIIDTLLPPPPPRLTRRRERAIGAVAGA